LLLAVVWMVRSRQILDARVQTLGPLHAETLYAKATLAGTLSEQGEYARAVELQTEVFSVSVIH
jgi:hypothetical protein